MKAIYLLPYVVERYWMKYLYIVFIDLEVYDMVPKYILWIVVRNELGLSIL